MGITATLGWYDASNRVEGGQSYRSLIQAGANERDARLISRGVGNLNAAIETGFSALGGKLGHSFKEFYRLLVVAVCKVDFHSVRAPLFHSVETFDSVFVY